MPASLATWENYELLRQQFPRAPAWGHVGSQGRATVIATEDTVSDPAIQVTEEAEHRPVRARKPNTRHLGVISLS